jgi:hypothetical protein
VVMAIPVAVWVTEMWIKTGLVSGMGTICWILR